MAAPSLKVVRDPDSKPGDPVLEVMLHRTGTRGRPGPPLDVEHWHHVDGEASRAVAWLGDAANASASRATVTRSRARIPVRRLDALPDWVHRALGLPEASTARIAIRLRTDGRPMFAWEVEGLGVGAPSPEAGFYVDGGRWLYLPPGLQEGLDGMGAPGARGPATIEDMQDRWIGFLPLECWERLRSKGSIRIRVATRCVLMARHLPHEGFRLTLTPVDPNAPDRHLLHDPYERFLASIQDTAGDRVPCAVSFEGEPIYMSEPFREEAFAVREFNRKSFRERHEWGFWLDQYVDPRTTPRAVARIESFGDRIVAYDEIRTRDYADLAATMRMPRGPSEAFERHVRTAPAQPLDDPAEMAALGAAFGRPEDALPALRDDADGDADQGEAGVGSDPLAADGGDVDGSLPASCLDAGRADAVAVDPAPDPAGPGGGEPAAPAIRQRTGVMVTNENLGRVVTLREGSSLRADPGEWDDRDLDALVATEDASGCPKDPLRPHQAVGVRWLWDAYRSPMGGVLLCDEPGTGKTLTMLLAALMLSRAAKDPILFVVEDSLTGFWCDELMDRIRGGRSFMRAFGSDYRKTGPLYRLAQMRARGLVLTTWGMLAEDSHTFQQCRFNVVLCDEASNAKNPLSLRRHALRGMRADFMVLATGTPIENGLGDLWSITDIVRPGHLGPWLPFKEDYVDERPTPAKLAGLHAILMEGTVPTLLHRTKESLGLNLPRKILNRVEIAMPSAQAEAYAKARAGYRSRVDGKLHHRLRQISLHHDFDGMRGRRKPPSQLQAMGWLRQSAVLGFTLERLLRAKAAGQKVILFTTDIVLGQEPVSMALGAALGLDGPVPSVSGRASRKEREDAIAAFRKAPGFAVLMLSNRLCARGLTLTEAHEVVMLSRWYNPAVEAQAMDRVHRLGLAHDVTIHIPLARHPLIGDRSYDIALDGLLARKSGESLGFLDPVVVGQDEVEAELLRAA